MSNQQPQRDYEPSYCDPSLLVNPLSEHFKCGICFELLNQATQCTEGHNFCKSCLSQALTAKKECPMCRTRTTLSQICTNRALTNVINEQVFIKCPTILDNTDTDTADASTGSTLIEPQQTKRTVQQQVSSPSSSEKGNEDTDPSSEKCTWQGALKDVTLHLSSCHHALMSCLNSGCDVVTMRCHIQQHADVCGERLVACEHCQKNIKFRLLGDHSNTCEMRLVACPNGCVDAKTHQPRIIPFGHMSQHRSECPEEKICCPYSSVGCEVMTLRKDMSAHQEDMAAHFSIQMAALLKLQNNQTSVVSYFSLFNSSQCGKMDAWRQLKDLSDGGDKVAQIYVMIIYLTGETSIDVPQNKVVAEGIGKALLPWLQSEAAEGSNLHAIYGLGVCYYNGIIGLKQKAGEYFRIAAVRGHAMAQKTLGLCHQFGRCGLVVNSEEAFKWYQLAAEQGLADGQLMLACCFRSATTSQTTTSQTNTLPRDDMDMALKWCRLAAEQGHMTAQYNLAITYGNGKGVTTDEAEAFKWYLLAANQGDKRAPLNLGVCYERGSGVDMSMEEALRWYRLAAAQGDEEAQAHVERLERSIV